MRLSRRASGVDPLLALDEFGLWQRTLGDGGAAHGDVVSFLRTAFLSFRDRAAKLAAEIAATVPGLTVHDITHLDALWRVAHEIVGPEYPLNPAEAFVLGGAFLIHDAAHVIAAYPGGLQEIEQTREWKDLIGQYYLNRQPPAGTPEYATALFHTLRQLHARQARNLLFQEWHVPTSGERLFLLENLELRAYYGHVIGLVAESHHWAPERVADEFKHGFVTAPAILEPADWTVDPLKLAFILRAADAAHIDAARAPWFLFALRRPEGVAEQHWRFQAKLGQPSRTDLNQLRFTSGSPFSLSDKNAWWLAYDTACMVDRELRNARALLRDAKRPLFLCGSVEHVETPESFARNVKTEAWEPVNVKPTIRNPSDLIANLGGARLYGDRPLLALRELIQNSADSIRALRHLGGLGPDEGHIEVGLFAEEGGASLHVTDTGLGMSRFVLTEVLLDFGSSLWTSDFVRDELPGLAASAFKAVGKFGIGFFSVFMLGPRVSVTTRRFERRMGEESDQWHLEFENGLDARPTLRQPRPGEQLSRPGTRVSVTLTPEKLEKCGLIPTPEAFSVTSDSPLMARLKQSLEQVAGPRQPKPKARPPLDVAVASLCPAINIKIVVRSSKDEPSRTAVAPNDWETLSDQALLDRLYPGPFGYTRPTGQLFDLREPDGELVGRLRCARGRAVICASGLRVGTLPSLVGLVAGINNEDLAREASSPAASGYAWKDWAMRHIDDLDTGGATQLHALCPSVDLPVYGTSEHRLSLQDLRLWLRARERFRVLDDYPEWDSDDDIGKWIFNQSFRLHDDVIVLPGGNREFEETVGAATIDYLGRLRQIVLDEWGAYEWITDSPAVGDADTCPIHRPCDIYTRRSP